jgi:hypothetical protein
MLFCALTASLVSTPAFAQQTNFGAILSGKNLSPPVKTIASGTAKFNVDAQGNMSYQLDVKNIKGVIGAHISLQNGTDLAQVFNPYIEIETHETRLASDNALRLFENYDIVVDGAVNEGGAWYYPAPKEPAANIKGRVAFWNGVLAPAGTPERTDSYRWISFVLTELDATLWTIAKHRFGLPKNRRVPEVIETAVWEFGVAANVLATGLGQRPFLVGDSFTVADILAGHTLLWGKSARIALDADALETYLRGLSTRDALGRARERTATRPAATATNP